MDYFYNHLNEVNKRSYDDIVNGLRYLRKDIIVSSQADIEILYLRIVKNYPEFFYVGNSFSYYHRGDKYVINPSYHYNEGQIRSLSKQIERISNSIINQHISQNQSDYEKALIIHDYLKKNIKYDKDIIEEPQSQKKFANAYTIVGALIERNCVCSGFAKAYKYLCDKVNLECCVIDGTALENTKLHAWNIVNIEEYYHHVDTTWDNQYDESDNLIQKYGYFALCDKEMELTHQWNHNFFVSCTDDPYNYFKVNESLLYTENQMIRYLSEQIRTGENFIMFKVERNSALASLMPSIFVQSIIEACKRCRYSSISGYRYVSIPEQLIYFLELNYD